MSNSEEQILKELKVLKEGINKIEENLKNQEGRILILEEKKKELTQLPEPIPYEKISKRPEIKKEALLSPSSSPIKPAETFEESMGAKWLPRLGMIALLFGLGFFLKYAFDHQWIGPTGRVILGLIAGVLLLFGGDHFENKKLHNYSRIFTGGGLTLLYLSLWAANQLYSLIDDVPTFVLMCFTTIAAGFFAVRYNSLVIAFYTLIGGFITPLLIGSADTGGTKDAVFTLIYYVILNLGILGLAFFKKWRIISFIAFLFTVVAYTHIYNSFFTSKDLPLSFFFLTLYFLIFAFVAFVNNIIYKKPTLPEDTLLILFNTAFYYGFSYYLLKPDYGNLLGLFTFCLAIFYLILAYLSFFYNPKDKYLVLTFLGLCSALVAAGIALQLKQYWVTLAWTLEALALVWVGFKVKEYSHQAMPTRYLGLILFIPPLIRLFAFDYQVSLTDFTPIFNKRAFIFLIYILALAILANLYSKNKDKISETEKNVVPISLGLGNILILCLISREIWDYFGAKMEYGYEKNLENQRNMWFSIVWALYSSLLMVIGFLREYKLFRTMALVLFGITILKVFFMDLSYLTGFPRILSFIILGFLLLGVGFIYNRYRDKIKEII